MRSPGRATAAGATRFGSSLLATALMLYAAAATAAAVVAVPPASCQCSAAEEGSSVQPLRLRSSPCSTKCTVSLDAAGGGGCRLTVACWNSTSTEAAELARDDLSVLLAEAAARLSTRSVASLRLSLIRTRATLALNATGLAALRHLSGNCRSLGIAIVLQSSRLIGVEPGFLDSLGGDVTIDATDTAWPHETASDAIDFGNGSVARLRLDGPSLTSQSMELRNLRAESVELRLATSEDSARRPSDWGLPAPTPPTFRLSNVRVTGSLSVEIARGGRSKARPASWALALDGVAARELRLAGFLRLDRPPRRSLASLTGLTVEADAELLTSSSRRLHLLEDIDSWAPSLRRLRLVDSGRLAAAVMERHQLTGLLVGRLLPQLQLLDLRGCGRLRLPAGMSADLEKYNNRCSEISLLVDDKLIAECNCWLDWLVTRCLNASNRVGVLCANRSSGPLDERLMITYESYSATSCSGATTNGQQQLDGPGSSSSRSSTGAVSNASSRGQDGEAESLTLILWVLLALSLAAILAGLTVVLAVFSPCRSSDLLDSSEKAEKLRSESNSSDASAASGSERARSENATNLKLLR